MSMFKNYPQPEDYIPTNTGNKYDNDFTIYRGQLKKVVFEVDSKETFDNIEIQFYQRENSIDPDEVILTKSGVQDELKPNYIFCTLYPGETVAFFESDNHSRVKGQAKISVGDKVIYSNILDFNVLTPIIVFGQEE